MEQEIKLFSMFSGYGGAEFALQKAGVAFKVVGYSEIDKYAIQCYNQNHKDIHNYGDCTKINPNNLPNFDLLTGGFPCQSFSNAGKGLGELDTRGTLVYDIIRIVEVKKPKYILLENVKGFTFKKFKDTFNKVLSELDRIGYKVHWKVLNSKDYGIPQNRERVWFVCIRKDLDQNFQFPEPLKSNLNLVPILNNTKTGYDTQDSRSEIGQAKRVYGSNGVSPPLNVGWSPIIQEKEDHIPLTLKDILEEQVDEKYYLSEKMCRGIIKSNYMERKPQDINKACSTIKVGGDVKCIKDHKSYISWEDKKGRYNTQDHRAFKENMYSGTVPAMERGVPNVFENYKSFNSEEANWITAHSLDSTIKIKNATKKGYLEAKQGDGISLERPNSKNRRGRVQQKSSPTLQCNDLNGTIDSEMRIRKLTPIECFRLMGFLQDEINLNNLSDTQKYKLAGNGWEINVVSLIFKRLLL